VTTFAGVGQTLKSPVKATWFGHYRFAKLAAIDRSRHHFTAADRDRQQEHGVKPLFLAHELRQKIPWLEK